MASSAVSVFEWKIDVTGRQGKRRKELLSGLKEKRGRWELKRNTRSHCMQNALCKRQRICKADYMIMINEKLEMDWRCDERL